MPKKYAIEVRLFAVQRKAEGHSWDRVAEMVMQNFSLDQPPSRRQMTKWVKDLDREAINRALMEKAKKIAETTKGPVLTRVAEGLLPSLWQAMDAGEHIEYPGWRWFFSVVEATLGSIKFWRFIDRYRDERKGQPDLPPAAFVEIEERRQQ